MSASHLSVIVCTYNRRDLLAGCLESLGRQTLSPDRFEVVVVDNNSRDDTAAVVEHLPGDAPESPLRLRTGAGPLSRAQSGLGRGGGHAPGLRG